MTKIIDKKRALKRKVYIRKLFRHYLTKVNLPVDLRIIDRDDLTKGYSCSKRNRITGRQFIVIDLPSIYNDRVKKGYGISYYKNRDNRLSFVKGNKKLALRFVILHELGHSILRGTGRNSEFNADSYAIDILNNEGLIKNTTIKHIEDWSCD
jgi:hypothetical protein